MIRVRNYNHVAIVVRDLAACEAFYGGLLGLETIPRPPFNFPGRWYRVGPDGQLHLMHGTEALPASRRHIALEVEDFAEALRALQASGVGVVEGPGKRTDGSDYLFCRDPDGNLVEITHHPAR